MLRGYQRPLEQWNGKVLKRNRYKDGNKFEKRHVVLLVIGWFSCWLGYIVKGWLRLGIIGGLWVLLAWSFLVILSLCFWRKSQRAYGMEYVERQGLEIWTLTMHDCSSSGIRVKECWIYF
jgi:hypothetical protein